MFEAAVNIISLGQLTRDFEFWAVTDQSGQTVAHWAAARGRLPEWFDLWELKNREGLTVAHEAELAGFLPATFTKFYLTDAKGRTVQNYIDTMANTRLSHKLTYDTRIYTNPIFTSTGLDDRANVLTLDVHFDYD